MSAFRDPDAFASWAGICPPNDRSADKPRKQARRASGKKLEGNGYVRRLLCEFINAAIKTACVFRAKYTSLLVRRGHKRAIACAHKMMRTIHAMLRKSEPYRDATVDLEALSVEKNAPRWIKALIRFGYLPATAATR